MAIRNRFAELVEQKAAREKRVILQEDIAKESGVSYSIVNHYMNDKVVNFNKSTLERLARWLECEPGDLIAWEDDAEKNLAAPGLGAARSAAL